MYEIWYMHGDPKSVNIHLKINPNTEFNIVMHPRKFITPELCMGYAAALLDYKEGWIAKQKTRLNLKGEGFFYIAESSTQKAIAIICDSSNLGEQVELPQEPE